MAGGSNFFRGTKFFYDWPYLECFDFLLRKRLAGQIFSGAQNFFTGYPILKKFVRARNFWVVHGKSATLTPDSKNKKIADGNFFVFGVWRQLRWNKYHYNIICTHIQISNSLAPSKRFIGELIRISNSLVDKAIHTASCQLASSGPLIHLLAILKTKKNIFNQKYQDQILRNHNMYYFWSRVN